VSNKDEQHVDGIADIVVHLTFWTYKAPNATTPLMWRLV
jgi:hypothetical protein